MTRESKQLEVECYVFVIDKCVRNFLVLPKNCLTSPLSQTAGSPDIPKHVRDPFDFRVFFLFGFKKKINLIEKIPCALEGSHMSTCEPSMQLRIAQLDLTFGLTG